MAKSKQSALDPTETSATPPQSQLSSRLYQGQKEAKSDVFKLKPSDMQINTSIDGQRPIFTPMSHGHVWHTVESNGKMPKTCCSVGGHFHEMELVENAEGQVMAKVSRAKKFVIRKNEWGEAVRETVDLVHDAHTHEADYLRTDMIKIRQVNPEWAKVEAQIAARAPSGVAGISEKI